MIFLFLASTLYFLIAVITLPYASPSSGRNIYLYFQEFPSLDCSGPVQRVRGVRSGVCQADLRFAAELLHEQFTSVSISDSVGVSSCRARVSAESESEWAVDLFGAQACEEESLLSSHNLSFAYAPPVRINKALPIPCDVIDVSRGKSLKLHWQYFVPPNLIHGATHLVERGYMNPPPDSTCADEITMNAVDFFSASRADTCLDRHLPQAERDALSYSFVCSAGKENEFVLKKTYYASSGCQSPLPIVSPSDQQCVWRGYNLSQIHTRPYTNSYTYSDDDYEEYFFSNTPSQNNTLSYNETYANTNTSITRNTVSTLSHFMCDAQVDSGENTWLPEIPPPPFLPPPRNSTSHKTNTIPANVLLLWEVRLTLGGVRGPNGSLLLQDEQLYLSLSELVCEALSLPRENCSCGQEHVKMESLRGPVSLSLFSRLRDNFPSSRAGASLTRHGREGLPALTHSHAASLRRETVSTAEIEIDTQIETPTDLVVLFAAVNSTMHISHVLTSASLNASLSSFPFALTNTSSNTSFVSASEVREEVRRRLRTGLSTQAQPWSRFLAETVSPHSQYWDEANMGIRDMDVSLIALSATSSLPQKGGAIEDTVTVPEGAPTAMPSPVPLGDGEESERKKQKKVKESISGASLLVICIGASILLVLHVFACYFFFSRRFNKVFPQEALSV